VEGNILWRNLVRWFVVCGVVILMDHAPEAIYGYQKWRQLAILDPLAAAFYRKVFWGEMSVAVLVVSIGSWIFIGLKKSKPPRGTSDGSTPR
jgi:hypothetical protein